MMNPNALPSNNIGHYPLISVPSYSSKAMGYDGSNFAKTMAPVEYQN
jgi:hypothetical protein